MEQGEILISLDTSKFSEMCRRVVILGPMIILAESRHLASRANERRPEEGLYNPLHLPSKTRAGQSHLHCAELE